MICIPSWIALPALEGLVAAAILIPLQIRGENRRQDCDE